MHLLVVLKEEQERMDYGKTRMACVTGEKSEYSNIYLKLKDLKVIGKILKKNVELIEYICFLMKKIQGRLLKDSNKHTPTEYMQIH